MRAQVEAGAWLILVPTSTDTMWGFNRVRLAARARALENQCYVAIAPTVGDAPWSATLDTNRGYAAVYGPVDRGFPEDGLLARGALDADQWVFADLDPARWKQVGTDGERAQPPRLARQSAARAGDRARMTLVYLVAGEASGDVLGGKLTAALAGAAVRICVSRA